MLSNGLAKSIIPIYQMNKTYPYDHIHGWTVDNFGPIWIPKKGATPTLTDENYSVYERAIRVYEGNKLEKKWKIYDQWKGNESVYIQDGLLLDDGRQPA